MWEDWGDLPLQFAPKLEPGPRDEFWPSLIPRASVSVLPSSPVARLGVPAGTSCYRVASGLAVPVGEGRSGGSVPGLVAGILEGIPGSGPLMLVPGGSMVWFEGWL